MKRGNAFPSKYLGRVDVEDKPILCTIGSVQTDVIKGEHGDETKPILYLTDQEKALILNGTNWDLIEEIATKVGVEDPGDTTYWTGMQIVLYFDPNVKFGARKTGGVRVRAPKTPQPAGIATPPPAVEDAPEEPPPLTDADVPF
jgi:hypothetical protein